MQQRLPNIIGEMSPVMATVVAALLIILGVLIIIYPALLQWVAGIGLILGGVALFATMVSGSSPRFR